MSTFYLLLIIITVILLIFIVGDPMHAHNDGFTNAAWQSRTPGAETLYDEIESRSTRRFAGLMTDAYLT